MRNPKRKTERGTASNETMLDAATAVIDNGASIRGTAKQHNVHYSTLCRFVAKVKAARYTNQPMPVAGYKPNRKIFTAEQEQAIVTYLASASDMFYGLSPKEARQLAFQCAVKFDVQFPTTWSDNSKAGEDWLSGFISRNPGLSIRTPEATSLAQPRVSTGQPLANFLTNCHRLLTAIHFKPPKYITWMRQASLLSRSLRK